MKTIRPLENLKVATFQNLEKVARNCPRALTTYLQVLCRSDDEGNLLLSRKEILDMGESFTKFRNDLRFLRLQDLLEWHQMKDQIHVTLALTDSEWTA